MSILIIELSVNYLHDGFLNHVPVCMYGSINVQSVRLIIRQYVF